MLLLLEHYQYVDSIYLDYSKAFDKCDHDIILKKLDSLGIGGKINQWISAFLKRRQQVVVVQGSKSSPVWCVSGVPQGSVLGPLLFLILMLDITSSIRHAILSSFADDTKIWKGISSVDAEQLLQADLDRVYVWAEQNNMSFNSKKFQAIRFAEMVSQAVYNTDVGVPMDTTELVKDLGVHISSDLHFDQHIRIVVNKGKRVSGWITRVFSTREPGVMLTLLKQLVYPTVEYNSVMWNPSDPSLIDALENIQRNFTRKIESPKLPANHDYWDRLRHYKLYSMQRRRERYAIFYVWKVIHDLYPNPGLHLNSTTMDHAVYPNKGIQIDAHQRRGLVPQHTDNPPRWLESCSILASSCALYNSLPASLRQPIHRNEEPNFPDFKRKVDEWLTSIPDQPTCSSRPKVAATNSILHQIQYRVR